MLYDDNLLKIVKEYGTPIFVIDESDLEKKQLELENNFSNLQKPVVIAYPYKVNSISMMLEYMHKKGRWAEIASAMELEMALNIGVNPKEIILNAPHKDDDLLKLALSVGCKIHLDNENELRNLVRLIDEVEHKGVIDIGVRISSPGNTLWSRFGFVEEELFRAVNIIKNNENIRLTGVHTHRSSINDLKEYNEHVEHVFKITNKLKINNGIKLEYVDLGSGFSIDWPKPSNSPNWSVPNLSKYVSIIKDALSIYKPDIHHLIVEPGRMSVASAGSMLTKIISVKEREQKTYITCDGALNFVPGAEIYKYRISRVGVVQNELNQIASKNVLCGCLCDSLDVLDFEIDLQNPIVNQILQISDVGGYDIARSIVWQLPYPPIVWVSRDFHYTVCSK